MCGVGGTGRAELECSVLEEDWQTGQSYMAHWHSLTLVPQHPHRWVEKPSELNWRWGGSTVVCLVVQRTVMEAESSDKHWEARRLLRRFLSGAISRNYTHPKTHLTRRPHQLISDPSTMGPKVQRGPAHIQKEEYCATTRAKGVRDEWERKSVVKIPGIKVMFLINKIQNILVYHVVRLIRNRLCLWRTFWVKACGIIKNCNCCREIESLAWK